MSDSKSHAIWMKLDKTRALRAMLSREEGGELRKQYANMVSVVGA